MLDPLYRTVDDNGKVLPPSNEVFQKISNEMSERGSHITREHVYTILQKGRGMFYKEVLRALNIDVTVNEHLLELNDDTLNSIDTTINKSKSFKIILSSEKWAKIKPERQRYGDKNYLTLKPDVWTHVVAETIYQQTDTICAISFKSGREYKRLTS